MKHAKLAIAAGLLALAGTVAAETVAVEPADLLADPSAPAAEMPVPSEAPGIQAPAGQAPGVSIDQGAQLATAGEVQAKLQHPGVAPMVAVVNPVPLPGALWLFGSALLGFMGFSGRRKV